MPDPLGRDEHGRDDLTHLPGVVPQYPLPDWAWHDDLLTTAAGLMAQVHDASAGFDTRSAIWRPRSSTAATRAGSMRTRAT